MVYKLPAAGESDFAIIFTIDEIIGATRFFFDMSFGRHSIRVVRQVPADCWIDGSKISLSRILTTKPIEKQYQYIQHNNKKKKKCGGV